MLRLYPGIFAEKTRFVILKFFKILLFILKRKFYFYFVPFICRFYIPAMSLNFSSLLGEIFVKLKILTVMALITVNDVIIMM